MRCDQQTLLIFRHLGVCFFGRIHFVLINNEPFINLVWNAHGLNNKSRRDIVCDVIQSSHAEIVCIQATKVADMNHTLSLSVFGSAVDKYVALRAQGTRGE
jgi:hypothetical protein